MEKMHDRHKLIFIHGVGEVQILIGTDILIIPGVYYTPDISLNILSAKQLELQGLELTFKGNKCRPVPMFKHPQDCCFDPNKMKRRQNKYMEDFYKLLEESSLEKREEDQKNTISKQDEFIYVKGSMKKCIGRIPKEEPKNKQEDTRLKHFGVILEDLNSNEESSNNFYQVEGTGSSETNGDYDSDDFTIII